MFERVLMVTMCTMWSCAWIHAADPPADPAVALAQILRARGIVTAADLASVGTELGVAAPEALRDVFA